MKKFIVIFTIAVMIFSFASCGKKNEETPTEKKDGIFFSAEDIGVATANGSQGFYILNSDGSFSPLIDKFVGYKRESDTADPTRFIWGTESEGSILKYIPVVEKGSKVVMMYNTDENIPDEYVIEKYNFKGYTLGAHFYSTLDQKMFLETEKCLAGSNIAQYIELIKDEKEYAVDRLNDSDRLPLKNIDNNIEMLLGLEEGKYYQIDFYKGTKYMGITAKADTFVFQSESVVLLTNPYTKTQNGYFILNLPDNLEEGYYYICGSGMCYITDNYND